MQFQHTLDYRQPQSDMNIAIFLHITSIKALEDMGQILFGNTTAGICDSNDNFA